LVYCALRWVFGSIELMAILVPCPPLYSLGGGILVCLQVGVLGGLQSRVLEGLQTSPSRSPVGLLMLANVSFQASPGA
jgi:hypothetical protein